MPNYTYECPDCSGRQSLYSTISERSETVACECGGTADQVYDWQGESIVVGREYDTKLDHTSLPIGWEDGNDGASQEARYKRQINEERAIARLNDRQAIKGGIRKIASVPREWARMRSRQFGKDYLDPSSQSTDDVKQKLKADNLLHKN